MFGRLEVYLPLRHDGFESSSANAPVCRRKPRRLHVMSMCKYLNGVGLTDDLIYLQVHRKTLQEIVLISLQFVYHYE